MYRQVKEYIIEYHMIRPGQTVLAGVSGGMDSMVMLHMLKRLQKEMGFLLAAVHVNHGIRGEEAMRDERLVEKTCREWGIREKSFFYDVPALARGQKKGVEEAAREVRKDAFRRAFEEISPRKRGKWPDGACVALAHNREDLAETMLHNLARGTGLRGISTMRPTGDGIIRPVLCLGREEIAEYAKKHGIVSVTDSTNLSDAYTRNRIRHHILPALQQAVNGKAAEHMAQTAVWAAQAEDYLSRQGAKLLAQTSREDGSYLLDEDFWSEEEVLKSYAILEAFYRLSGQKKDFTAIHVKDTKALMQRQPGRSICLPKGITARRVYEGISLSKIPEKIMKESENKAKLMELPVPGECAGVLGSFSCEIFLHQGEKIEEKTYTKWFDYDKIVNNLCIRTRCPGDYMVIDQKGSKKKLSRIMIDDKIPGEKRDTCPLLVSGSEVLWMVGGRMNEKYKITPETVRILAVHYQGGIGYE